MPALALDRRGVVVVVLAVFLVLALGGRTLLRGGERAAVPPLVRAAPSGGSPSAHRRLYVHVVGGVRHPGLYRLPPGSRVADAVARAGGVTPKADVELVNLAAPVADGQQIVVPRRGARGSATA